MTVFANLSNGTQSQIKLEGDMNEIFKFIENYKGNDLGNDLICEPFVENFTNTGIIIKQSK